MLERPLDDAAVEADEQQRAVGDLPASSIAFGPEAAMIIGMRRLDT